MSTSTTRKRKANNTAVQFEDNLGLSVPLNFDLSVSLVPRLLDWFTEEVVAFHKEKVSQGRPSTIVKIKDALSLVLANLLSAHRISAECFVRISRSPNSYKSRGNRYLTRAISFDCLMQVIDYLADRNHSLIAFANGFDDKRDVKGINDKVGARRRGMLSRIKATGDLLAIVVKHLEYRSTGSVADGVAFSNLPPITNRISIPGEMIVSSPTSDAIELRAAKGGRDSKPKPMKYTDDDETKRMRSNISRWNAFAERHWIDLFLSEDQLEHLYQNHALENPGNDRFFFKKNNRPQFVELNRVRLHRIFNNGSFDEGGRFYGGWWQEIPKQYRKYVTINGNPTNEVDYGTIHPAMLFAQAGLPLPEDSYSIPGLEEYRDDLAKPTFLKLINARKKNIEPPQKVPEGWTWSGVKDAIIKKHQPIHEHLYSGIGLKLQRKDSDIAEGVMLRMMELGHLALPIHDSFLVAAAHTETLKQVMKAVYRNHTDADIQLKVQSSFIDEVEIQCGDDERPSPTEIFAFMQADPGYEGYRERQSEFGKSRGKEQRLPVVPAPSLVPDHGKRSHRDIVVTPVAERPGVFEACWNGRHLVESHQPFLDSARRLLEIGADPDEELRMYHHGSPDLALKGRIGLVARLTVEEGVKDGPYFRRWKAFHSPDGSPKIGGKSDLPGRGPDRP